ncbi:MAG: hypothetical protein H7Y13_16335 [Sphingobacteriaceae bacterium]|nr:hypothetical protein [Sphingobacteriaceae bacterium]
MEEEEKIISATDEDQLWEKVIADFKADPDPLEYHAVLEQNDRRIILDIFNNHAVGFEAVAYVTFSAYLYGRDNFRFSIYNEGFTEEIGKFFGMQDFLLGYRNFDQRFIIKTNNEQKLSSLFADMNVRDTLISLPNLSLGIVEYTLEEADGKVPFLELKIEKAINDPAMLRKIYHTFFSVLLLVEA